MRVIDPKYHIEGEKIINTYNGQEIPEDEPLMLFRARDNCALAGALIPYKQECIESECTKFHIAGSDDRIDAFTKFAKEYPERMKQPGITEGK